MVQVCYLLGVLTAAAELGKEGRKVDLGHHTSGPRDAGDCVLLSIPNSAHSVKWGKGVHSKSQQREQRKN